MLWSILVWSATAIIAAGGVVLLLPVLSDVLSLMCRRPAAAGKPDGPAAVRPALLFLVPAHNESLLLAGCLRALRDLRYPDAQVGVVVIADHCTDDTADIARSLGVPVLEPPDSAPPGKPYAMAWALDTLPLETFDAVIVIDADTLVDRDFAAAIAAAAPLHAKAVQGTNGVRNPEDSALTRLAATFAAGLYGFAYPLKQRAGLSVPLRGTGCVIGTGVLRDRAWSAFGLGEDWDLYAQLVLRGVPVVYVAGARVYAQEARSLDQAGTQRTRWSAGRLAVLAQYAVAILTSDTVSVRQRLDLLAELSAPGPVVHLGLVVGCAAAAAALGGPAAPLLVALLAISLVRPAVYTMAVVITSPNRARTLGAFAYLPVYLCWRVVREVRTVLTLGGGRWIRTARHPATDPMPVARDTARS